MGVEGTSYFEVVGSPSLYPTQTVRAAVRVTEGPPPLAGLFIDTYGGDGKTETVKGVPQPLVAGVNELEWRVPNTDGRPVYRLGLELTSPRRVDGSIVVEELDWAGAPGDFILGRAIDLSPDLTPWTTDTVWLRTFVSSASHFAPDYTTTFSISHADRNGVVTTGSRDWANYSVSSTITFNQQEGAGLVARARGHRRYYAALLARGRAMIVKQHDRAETLLAERAFDYTIDDRHRLEFRLRDGQLEFLIDGEHYVAATDSSYASGGAGFVVHCGAILADGFRIQSA
jgi:hypothetical protein